MPGLTDEEEEREQPQPHIAPKIEEIVKLVERDGPIDKLEEKLATHRGTLAQKYQHIEKDLHGNRKAVKLVRSLLGGTTDAAYDFMRTFMRLANRFRLLPEDDLVDMAEGVHQREAGTDGNAVADEPGVKVSDMAPKTPKSNVTQLPKRETAIDRATKALEGGDKPEPDEADDLAEAGKEVAREIEAQRRKDAEAFDNHNANSPTAA